MKLEKKISYIGIVTCILYFAGVMLFLVTKTEIALTIWELLTIIGGPAILIVLIALAKLMNIAKVYNDIMLVFLSCTCALTGAAHIVNITVTRKLMADGVNVPDYFKIGYWPSVEMAVDYLAWGLFMGLAFLAVGVGIKPENRMSSSMRKLVLICGSLCLIGFLGTVFINVNIWYVAPLGYGFGTILICIQMLRISKANRLQV